MNTHEDTGWATKIIRALDEFRAINKNVTANQIVVFLHIATKKDISQKELEKVTGLDNGTVSRICAILSDRGAKKRNAHPLDLIRIGLSPVDYRARAQNLSAKGRKLFERLRIIQGA